MTVEARINTRLWQVLGAAVDDVVPSKQLEEEWEASGVQQHQMAQHYFALLAHAMGSAMLKAMRQLGRRFGLEDQQELMRTWVRALEPYLAIQFQEPEDDPRSKR